MREEKKKKRKRILSVVLAVTMPRCPLQINTVIAL